MSEIICKNYKAMNKGALEGIATIEVPKWGIEIFNISIFKKHGKRWMSFPSRKGDDGKYYSYLRFVNKDHLKKFESAILNAIDKFSPTSEFEEDLDVCF